MGRGEKADGKGDVVEEVRVNPPTRLTSLSTAFHKYGDVFLPAGAPPGPSSSGPRRKPWGRGGAGGNVETPEKGMNSAFRKQHGWSATGGYPKDAWEHFLRSHAIKEQRVAQRHAFLRSSAALPGVQARLLLFGNNKMWMFVK